MSEITLWPIENLHEWDKNPRSITPADFERLKIQIQKLGQYKPLIITPDGTVLGGNMRLKAYRELKVDKVWVSIVNPKDEAEMVEYALSDNDRAGYYNADDLVSLADQYDIDLSLYAVDINEPTSIEDLLKQLEEKRKDAEEDEAPSLPSIPISIPGKVYQLGRHRVMCGDATKPEDIYKLMGNNLVDMIFTDPPYNVDYTGKTKDALKIDNDSFEDQEFYKFLVSAFTCLSVVAKAGAPIYVCHADSEGLNFRLAFKRAGFLLKQCIIWNKNVMVMGRQDYQWKHEPILYGWKDGAPHLFYGGRDKVTVWDIPRPTRSAEHPTMKPLALITEALYNSSRPGSLIVDTFGGSGSTLIAAEQTNRICFMMELDPAYVDVIRQRYANYIKAPDWQAATPEVQNGV